MKLITLNTWGARIRDPFIKFIKEYQDIDIFCLQEVYDKAEGIMDADYPLVHHSLFSELHVLLPNHKGFFRPVLADVYGIAIFVKKGIKVIEEGEVSIHNNSQQKDFSGHHSRNLQWITLDLSGEVMTIANVHGLWNGKGKTDTPERILQSTTIKGFVDSVKGKKVLCGDFNLNPDTESIKILEVGMKNLVKDYKIESTRTSLYTKPGKYADYIFISPEITEKIFKVLPDEVSDHSALFLEI